MTRPVLAGRVKAHGMRLGTLCACNSIARFDPLNLHWIRIFALQAGVLIIAGCGYLATPIPSLPQGDLTSTPTVNPNFFRNPISPSPRPGTPTPSEVPWLTLSAEVYKHPSRAFELPYPAGWRSEASEFGVWFTSPDGESQIQVQYTASGYPLDRTSLTKLAEAHESAIFRQVSQFTEIERRSAHPNSLDVIATYVSGGVKMASLSCYRQAEEIVLVADFWTTETRFPAHQPQFMAIADSISLSVIEDDRSGTYAYKEYFRDDRGLIEFEVPVFWAHKQITEEYGQSDSFTAPDGHAGLQSILYDDGEEVSRPLAARFTLSLLNENYGPDIIIQRDTFLGEAGEQLDWFSPGSHYSGRTVFRAQGSTIWVLTAVYDHHFETYYRELVESILTDSSFLLN